MLRGDRGDLKLSVVCGLGLGRWNVADRLEQATVVEPVDPFEGGELDGLEGTPRSASMDHLGFEQADHCLGERVVIAVSNAADRGLDTSLRQTFGVAKGLLRIANLVAMIPLCSFLRR